MSSLKSESDSIPDCKKREMAKLPMVNKGGRSQFLFLPLEHAFVCFIYRILLNEMKNFSENESVTNRDDDKSKEKLIANYKFPYCICISRCLFLFCWHFSISQQVFWPKTMYAANPRLVAAAAVINWTDIFYETGLKLNRLFGLLCCYCFPVCKKFLEADKQLVSSDAINLNQKLVETTFFLFWAPWEIPTNLINSLAASSTAKQLYCGFRNNLGWRNQKQKNI